MLFVSVDNDNPVRELLPKFFDNRQRIIGRTVVADIQEEIVARLPEQRLELFLQEPCAVVGRKQYGNLSTIPFHSLSKRTTNANYSRYVYPYRPPR